MKQGIAPDDYGVFVLEANGEEYVCTSLLLEYKINAIPSARVTIGFGAGIKDNIHAQDPTKLLSAVLAHRGTKDKAYNGMVECTISEQFSSGDPVIVFKGVIVTGTPVYRASDKYSSKMISFLCLNKICELYVSPLSSFITAHNSFVINKMTTDGYILTAEDARRQQLFEAKLDIYRTINLLVPDSINVLDGVDRILYAYLRASSYTSGTGDQLPFYRLSNYLFSRIRVKKDLMKNVPLEKSFYHRVGDLITAMLDNMSLYDMLQRMLITDEFMLNLVPRFSAYDFKVELVPSYMWNTRKADDTTIEAEDLVGVSAAFNPIACLNTPQVLMALFEDPVNYGGDQSKGKTSTNYGIYSTDKNLDAALKAKRDKAQDAAKLVAGINKDSYYRCQVMRAPVWLYPKTKTKEKSSLTDNRTNKKPPTGNTDPPATDSPTKKVIEASADLIAQALFAHRYGRQDTATLKLSAALRFRYLEEHLGGTVTVKLEEEDNNPMNFCGVLNSVSFSYVSGASSQVDYSAELICVRPVSTNDDEEQGIDCVLYEDLPLDPEEIPEDDTSDIEK